MSTDLRGSPRAAAVDLMELDELDDAPDDSSVDELAGLVDRDGIALEQHGAATALVARQCQWLLREQVPLL